MQKIKTFFFGGGCKSFIISTSWERDTGRIKSCLVAAERSFKKLWHQTGSSNAAGLLRLLVTLEGEPFNEMLAQHHLRTSHPAEVSHVVIHLLGEFHLLREVCRSARSLFRFLSVRMTASALLWFYPTCLGMAPTCSGRGRLLPQWFVFSGGAGCLLTSPRPIAGKSQHILSGATLWRWK